MTLLCPIDYLRICLSQAAAAKTAAKAVGKAVAGKGAPAAAAAKKVVVAPVKTKPLVNPALVRKIDPKVRLFELRWCILC